MLCRELPSRWLRCRRTDARKRRVEHARFGHLEAIGEEVVHGPDAVIAVVVGGDFTAGAHVAASVEVAGAITTGAD
jgi:hypothetical protein